MNLGIMLKWLGSWAALLLLSMFSAEGVHFAAQGAGPGAMPITLALCYSWLAVLLMPVNSGNGAELKIVMLWSAISATGFLALLSSPFYFEQESNRSLLAGGVLTLILLFSAMQSLIRTYTPSRVSSMALFTLIAGSFSAAPLYLSVVAETLSHRAPVIDSIIAASPVSYLAGIADYDYLRSSWFYQYTPFGGLRFNYPSPGVMTVCYVITTLVLVGAKILRIRSESRTPNQ